MPWVLRGVARVAVISGTATGRSRRNQVSWRPGQSRPSLADPQPRLGPGARRHRPPPPAAPDPLEQLKQLGELKAQGVLTEAEFEAQKAKILAGVSIRGRRGPGLLHRPPLFTPAPQGRTLRQIDVVPGVRGREPARAAVLWPMR